MGGRTANCALSVALLRCDEGGGDGLRGSPVARGRRRDARRHLPARGWRGKEQPNVRPQCDSCEDLLPEPPTSVRVCLRCVRAELHRHKLGPLLPHPVRFWHVCWNVR